MTPSQVLDCYQERIQYAWPSQVGTIFVGTILTPKTVKLNFTWFLFHESLNPTGMHIVDCCRTPNHLGSAYLEASTCMASVGPVICEVLV